MRAQRIAARSIFKQRSSTDTASRSRRRLRASFAGNVPLSEFRGRRECRAPDAPAVSCALVVSAHEVVTTVTPESPGIPYAMVLTGSFVLSPVIGLVCHRRQRIRRVKSPVGPTCLRKLDASVGASGPHDFAVRVSAIRQRRRPRPPHPAAHVRDDRETPLRGGGTELQYSCFYPAVK